MQLLGIVGAIAFGLLALTPSAQAAPPMEDKAQARLHFEAGARHYDLSEWDQALVEFKEAYRQMPDPSFLYNIAQCHRRLGHGEDALTFYRTYLRRAPEAVNRDEVERRIAELEAEKQAQQLRQAEEDRQHNAAAGPLAPAQGSEAARPSLLGHEPPGDRSDEQVSLTQAPADSSSGHGSIFTRWWFWTAVGALVTGGVVAGLLLSRGGGTKPFCPDCANSAGVNLP
jgi:tetratricopeptide (TPR) repeat protein